MKSKKRAFFFTLLLLMVCVVVQAQSLQVEGTVISKSDGEPIIGATVLESGTTNGTITDLDGKFLLTVTLLSGENSLKQLLLTNNQLVTRLIKFFD